MTPECPTCAKKWGKALWAICCVCTGHVSLIFKPPGDAKPAPKPAAPITQELFK